MLLLCFEKTLVELFYHICHYFSIAKSKKGEKNVFINEKIQKFIFILIAYPCHLSYIQIFISCSRGTFPCFYRSLSYAKTHSFLLHKASPAKRTFVCAYYFCFCPFRPFLPVVSRGKVISRAVFLL